MDERYLKLGYDEFLRELKERIRNAQVRAALAVNRELVLLYWQIGNEILYRQQQQGWGSKVINRLATDLRKAFPDIKGFSARNLNYMRAFAEAYPDETIVQQVVALIPWGHNVRILDAVKTPEERIWYIQQTIQYGWSRNILIHQMDSHLYRRQGSAITNFSRVLPDPQSELAQQVVKNPYSFDFLSLGKEALERELESALIKHIREFLLELGVGFSFVGSQYPLVVDGKDYRIDLLFYHFRLHCFVVIDLKVVEFEPEFSGKMNFYVSAVDDLLRSADDNPTIGVILCRTKSKTIAEYALRDVHKPIGISTYHMGTPLPTQFQSNLPTIEALEEEIETVAAEVEQTLASQEAEQLDLFADPARQEEE
jgi:predicted nuclease of restriction endonuclease-like (RecB) superfamily